MQDEVMLYGVDVSKAELVVATHPKTVQRVVPNQATAIKAWLRTLAKSSCIAAESTGRYSAALVRLAQAAGMTVYVLNARDVYFYAKALGVRGKTDASDAQVIARYLAEHRPRRMRTARARRSSSVCSNCCAGELRCSATWMR